MKELINFQNLVTSIIAIDDHFKEITSKAINKNFTIRNWLIGAYIVMFEQDGKERAEYGNKVIDHLSIKLNKTGLGPRNLRLYRQFYVFYPDLVLDLKIQEEVKSIWQSSTAKFQHADNQEVVIWQLPTAKLKSNFGSLENETIEIPKIPNDKLLENISFTHFASILSISDPLKRVFYELETIKGRWSVSQLKRQINTLYYERSAMSKGPISFIKDGQ
jgi:hypothetical protein